MDTLPRTSPMIPDVQGSIDHRSIPIHEVGIRSIRHPLLFLDRDPKPQPTVATFDMFVSLPATQKGAHMSRFVAILNERVEQLSVASMPELLHLTAQKLEADEARVRCELVHFIQKSAPVTGVHSLMDYSVALDGSLTKGQISTMVEVIVPVTSLCPCSKKISNYGAHNQRSHVTVRARIGSSSIFICDLIDAIEAQACSQLYGLLKRPDEKFVTETAYDNPKFVEDMVRDVAVSLRADNRILGFDITCENFESIHNHSAFARVIHNHQINCD